jgi:hypothetical protein
MPTSYLISVSDTGAPSFVDAASFVGGGSSATVVEARSGGSTLAAADNGKVLLCAEGSVSLPTTLPVGFSVTIVQITVGQVRFLGAPIRHFQNHNATLAQYGVAGLLVIEPGVYLLTGATAAA